MRIIVNFLAEKMCCMLNMNLVPGDSYLSLALKVLE